MECERIRDLLSDYRDGSLPESEVAAVSAHLRECRKCAEVADGLENTLRLLRDLPPVQAPPELLERILRETAEESPAKPLWKKLFLPAHVKIPIEAAAAILLFLLVYGAQKKETTAVAPPPPAPRMEAAAPGADKAIRPESTQARKTNALPRTAAAPEAGRGKRIAKRGDGEPGGRGTVEAKRSGPQRGAPVSGPVAAASSPSAPSQPQSALPVVPVQRASTAAERIEPVSPPAENAGMGAPQRMLAAPPSRLLRPLPYGREVTLEVGAADRPGLEERIAEVAQRLRGSVVREPGTDSADLAEKRPFPEAVRVQLPADSSERFFSELRNLGTIPPGGVPGWTDLPAGPSPGTVLYTVRIRVR